MELPGPRPEVAASEKAFVILDSPCFGGKGFPPLVGGDSIGGLLPLSLGKAQRHLRHMLWEPGRPELHP